MAKIVLINPDPNPWVKSSSLNFSVPMGIHVIATTLKKENHEVILLDSRLMNIEKLKKIIKKEIKDTLLFAFTVMTAQISDALTISKYIKTLDKTKKVLWGGIHPSILPNETLKSSYVDYIIIGEGETPSKQLVKVLENKKYSKLKDIPSLGYKEKKKIHVNKIGKIMPMEEIPITDWNIVDAQRYMETYTPFYGKLKQVQIQSSRGCPYLCTYCINTAIEHYKKWRLRTLEDVEKELTVAKNELGAEEIFFRDENFFVNVERARKIAKICKKLGLKWEAQSRVNYFNDKMLSKEVLKELEENNCILIALGAESGSNKVLKDIKKYINKKQIITSAKMLAKTKIVGLYAFMIGFPTETKEDIKETIDVMKKIRKVNKRTFFANVGILRPYPGCEIYDDCLKLGYQEPQSIEEWAEYDLATFRGAVDLKNYPWIKDPEFVYAVSLYMQFALAPYKAAPSLSIKAFTFISKARLSLGFWRFPYEYKIFLKIKELFNPRVTTINRKK